MVDSTKEDIIYDIDIWGKKEETKLEETISLLTQKLIKLEQEMYVESKIVEDKEFARKYRVALEHHIIHLKKLKAERQEIRKLLRGFEKELAKEVARRDLEDIEKDIEEGKE